MPGPSASDDGPRSPEADRRAGRRLAWACGTVGVLVVLAGLLFTPARLQRLVSPDGAFTELTRARVASLRLLVIACGALLAACGAALVTQGPGLVAWARRHGHWLRRAVLASAATLVALLLGEVLCRIDEHVNPPPGAGFDFARYATAFIEATHARGQLDRHGYRELHLDAPPEPGVVRVLFVGDSFVYGLGIPEAADTLPAQLERALVAAGVRAQVLDAGVCGADTEREISVLQELVPRTRPDLVLLGYYPNDIETDAIKADYESQARLVPMLSDQLLACSALWRRIEPLAMHGLQALGLRQTYTRHLLALHTAGSPAFAAQQQRLRRLQTLAGADGRRCAAVLIPVLDELNPYPLEDVHAALRAHFAEQRVPCLDLLDSFRGTDARDWQVSAQDHHLDAAGAARAAQALATWLLSLDLLRPAGATPPPPR